jgi:hypothetical protein
MHGLAALKACKTSSGSASGGALEFFGLIASKPL